MYIYIYTFRFPYIIYIPIYINYIHLGFPRLKSPTIGCYFRFVKRPTNILHTRLCPCSLITPPPPTWPFLLTLVRCKEKGGWFYSVINVDLYRCNIILYMFLRKGRRHSSFLFFSFFSCQKLPRSGRIFFLFSHI